MATREKIFNVPNLISFYRLASFPFILWMIHAGLQELFAIFFCINLVSDILDGLIARLFQMSTQFGARLDSVADITLFLSAIYGIIQFKWTDFGPYSTALWIAVGVYLTTLVVSYIRFGKYPSLHLYSAKVGAYVQGLFFFVLFVWGFYRWLFVLAFVSGVGSWIEEIAVLMILKEMRSNSRGLFWVLRK